MSSSTSTPASSSITRDIEGLLASVRNWIENAKVAVEPQSEGEVETLAGMSAMLREGSAEVIDMRRSWILRTAAVEYLEERRRKNLNRLGDWAREREESSEGGSECNYDWA